MKSRRSNLMVGSLTLALIAGVFGGVLGYQKFAASKQRVPLRVVFEGSASGLRKGGSVVFGGIRIGEVVSLKLDNPRRVVALAMIDNSAPVRQDTAAGLEFQGLTGIAALSLTGGSPDAPPVPHDVDGIPVLTADADATEDVQTKIKAAMQNVNRVIIDNEAELTAMMDGLASFTALLANSGDKIDSVVNSAATGADKVDASVSRTLDFLRGLEGVDFAELKPTVKSMRELVRGFDRKSAVFIAESRSTLIDVNQSVTAAARKWR